MKKFIALFCIPAATMDDWMAKTDESARKEQMDQIMKDWKVWAETNAASIVDQGSPLGKNKRVTKDGMTDVRNDLNFVMTVQAESQEEAANLFLSNPHVMMIPDSYVEIMGTEGPAPE